MSNVAYLQGRNKYGRPQAIMFANNPGTVETINPGEITQESFYVPLGYDLLSNQDNIEDFDNYFMILSDDNREQLDFSIDRIEKRERMINGRMRSHHIADKISVSASWTMLPSRSAANFPSLGLDGQSPLTASELYTTDNGAGGVEILDWYEANTGSFWVYLSYDKYNQTIPVISTSDRSQSMLKYNQVVEMFFSDFSYSVVKRGRNNFDFWNINFTLEEV